MTAQPSYLDKTMHLAPSDQDVWGNERDVTADDIDVGWSVSHATDRYLDAEGEVDERSGQNVGTYKVGAVVNVYDEAGVRMVTVVEDRMVERRLVVRRFDWPVTELDLSRCYPVGQGARHAAAKKIAAAIGWNKGTWSFHRAGDEFLVASMLALTEPERVLHAAVPASCAEGHCVEVGECREAKAHIGVCCSCGAPVAARSMR